MSNLITTVIGIALVAITALAGIFYGSTAYNTYIAQSRANLLMNQAKQVYQATTQCMLDQGKTSFSDVGEDAPALANYTQGRVPILNFTPTAANGTVPLAAGTNAVNVDFTNKLDSYAVKINRTNCQTNGVNKVIFDFGINDPYNGNPASFNGNFADVTEINHPIVKMCKALNAKANLPSGLTYAASGLPYAQGTRQTCRAGIATWTGMGDGYCYLDATASGSFAIELMFSN